MVKIVKIQNINKAKITERFNIKPHFVDFLLKKKIISLPISKDDETFLKYLSKFLLDRDFISMQIESVNEEDFFIILEEMYRDDTSYMNNVIFANLKQRLVKNKADEYEK